MEIKYKNRLYYGDNLDILRKKIPDESVDLCYIDPPFNSKRSYNQIYLNIGEDKAQSQAFIDTWSWDTLAEQGYKEITLNEGGRFTVQTIELIKGLRSVLPVGSLLAYLVSMTLRITEIQRVLKRTGSFYLHCDPTCSHYLKLILDAVFCPKGGDFRNEIVWHYRRWTNTQAQFQSMHDVILFYTKSQKNIFNLTEVDMSDSQKKKFDRGWDSNVIHTDKDKYSQLIVYNREKYDKAVKEGKLKVDKYKNIIFREKPLVPSSDVIIMPVINSQAKERLGYPTQKPEALLERIIKASSNEGDTVLDAYCGCGTTVAVAERLKRNWVGIDITYQSISLILKRLEDSFGKKVLKKVMLDGIPRDIESARALATKQDDRLRKEFEKWALLTYTNNRGIPNDKKGADKGIDGTAYFATSGTDTGKAIFQVKSGSVKRDIISVLNSDMQREKAEMAFLITLNPPTKPMIEEAVSAGVYHHPLMGRDYSRINIVTIEEIINQRKRFEMPTGIDVLKKAPKKGGEEQTEIDMDSDPA